MSGTFDVVASADHKTFELHEERVYEPPAPPPMGRSYWKRQTVVYSGICPVPTPPGKALMIIGGEGP